MRDIMHADQTIYKHYAALLRTFDKISDYVFFMEVDGPTYRYAFVNEPGQRAIGWKEDDLGKSIEDLVPPETALLIRRHYDEAVRDRKSVVFEDYRLADSFFTDTLEATDVLSLPLHYFESEVTPVFEGDTCTHVISVVREVTERKRRELELTILHDQHESLRRYSPHGIFVLDHQFRIKSLNPAVTTITGYAEADLIDRSFLDCVDPSERDTVQAGLEHAMAGSPHKYKIRGHRRSGTPLDLAILNIPIEVGGHINGLFAIIIDHTPEKDAERATQESERRYRQLIETIPEGIIVHREGEIVYANTLALETIGESTITGMSIFTFIAPEYREAAAERLASMRLDDAVHEMELVVTSRDGRSFRMDVASLVIDYEGTAAILSVLRDVTEKRDIEQALRQSEMRYRLITENMSDLVCMLESDGTVRYASPSHLHVLGYPPSFYEGKNTLDFIHPRDVELTRLQLHASAHGSEPLTLEFRHAHDDGRWIWLETKIQAIYSEDGKLLHYLTVTREIMQRKVVEKQLRHLAYHDTLTDLPNRRYFLAYLEESLARIEEETEALAILSLDLDRFKQINDTLGHDVGDELLRQFASRLKTALRKQDVVARFGGDEFAVLIRYNDPVAPHRVAEKLLTSLKQPWRIEGHTFVTTSSIGIACCDMGVTPKQLLKQADLALYEAKSNGRNRYTLFQDRS